VGITQYIQRFDYVRGVSLFVWFETSRDEVVDFALVLVVRDAGRLQTVRVYDGTHGSNEMHRYTKDLGKQRAEVFYRGTLGEGMRVALEHVNDT
jgi:hypothetical protein